MEYRGGKLLPCALAALYIPGAFAACGSRTGLGVALIDDFGRDDGGTSNGDAACTNDCAPSCAPGGAGLTDCGTSRESCCASLEVTGGTFYRTYTNTGGGPTGEADPATVSGFRLDKYLVTVARFRQFANAWTAGFRPSEGVGKHLHSNAGLGLVNVAKGQFADPSDHERGWIAADDMYITPSTNAVGCNHAPLYAPTWTASPAGQETLPINCVNWYEAYAFCIWDGGFLPSDAELEYAGAGGSQQRRYPWGNASPGTDSRYAIYDCNYPSGPSMCSGVLNVAPVGTAALGAGLWGQLDLSGEIAAWDLDGFADSANPCVDCAFVVTGLYGRTTRAGGSFKDSATYLSPTTRGGGTASARTSDFGIRCARVP